MVAAANGHDVTVRALLNRNASFEQLNVND